MAGPETVVLGRAAETLRGLVARAVAHWAGPVLQEPPAPEQAQPPTAGAVGDCALYERGRRGGTPVPLHRAGALARRTDGFVWVALQDPTVQDVAAVATEFRLPPLAVEDAVKAHQRPKLEVYGDIVFAVLKPVRYVDPHEVVEVAEIAVFVGDHFVVTVRHGDTDVLGRLRAELDAGSEEQTARGPAGVLYRAADLVVDGYEQAVVGITEDVDEIESQVFSGRDDDHSERIYKLKREVAEFRRAALPLAAPLGQLADQGVVGAGTQIAPYFRDVHDHLMRAGDAIEGFDRLLSDVLQANLARVGVRQNAIAVRQNEDMRKISAWAAVGLVPTAVAGIYGMNFEYMPELRWRYGYFLVVGAIAVVCLVLHRLFRRNGWL